MTQKQFEYNSINTVPYSLPVRASRMLSWCITQTGVFSMSTGKSVANIPRLDKHTHTGTNCLTFEAHVWFPQTVSVDLCVWRTSCSLTFTSAPSLLENCILIRPVTFAYWAVCEKLSLYPSCAPSPSDITLISPLKPAACPWNPKLCIWTYCSQSSLNTLHEHHTRLSCTVFVSHFPRQNLNNLKSRHKKNT